MGVKLLSSFKNDLCSLHFLNVKISDHRGLCRDANLLVGIPTTDVLIESVEKRVLILSHQSQPLSSDSLPPQEQESCAKNVNAVDLLNDFICELKPRKKYLKVHCRVSIYLSLKYAFTERSFASISRVYSCGCLLKSKSPSF
jgi:hypothetical protein